jgi:hypothetical protein
VVPKNQKSLLAALELGKRIICVDETIITSKTKLTRAFSNQRCNVTMPKMPPEEPAIHVVVGVSAENGFECAELYQKSVNSTKFIKAIERIS